MPFPNFGVIADRGFVRSALGKAAKTPDANAAVVGDRSLRKDFRPISSRGK